jgi:pSer/pThr/pTyr-binding forkhead associated (FHA) protein
MASPMLIFIHGPLAGKRISLEKDEMTVGRSDTNDVVLKDPLVSRVHAIFISRAGAWLIDDLGSHNGTYVNDERLHSVHQVRHGDRISVGASKIMFEDARMTMDDATQIIAAPTFVGATFTQRQIQVLRLMARGLSNKQIAERLFVSERTVKAYAQSVFEKLGVNKRAAAVAGALRLGLIEAPGEDDDADEV